MGTDGEPSIYVQAPREDFRECIKVHKKDSIYKTGNYLKVQLLSNTLG